MPGVTRVEAAMHGAFPALVEVSSTKFTRDAAADPWDDSITIAAGSNRVLLDFCGLTDPGTHATHLDPATLNIALTENANSPQAFGGTSENVVAFHLLEAAFSTASGSLVLRGNWTTTRRGRRRVVLLSGASQTIHTAGANADSTGPVTVTVSRTGGGNFAAGSLFYVAFYCESGVGYTLSGDVTQVDNEIVTSDADVWIFGSGTVGGAGSYAASINNNSGTTRMQGIGYVVEPA